MHQLSFSSLVGPRIWTAFNNLHAEIERRSESHKPVFTFVELDKDILDIFAKIRLNVIYEYIFLELRGSLNLRRKF